MRKLIIPLLIAGGIAFTAASAMATANTFNGDFNEEHSLVDGFKANHYKSTDVVEHGRHGFQLDSAILKLVAGDTEGYKADDAWGYVTGSNPFVAGFAGGSA